MRATRSWSTETIAVPGAATIGLRKFRGNCFRSKSGFSSYVPRLPFALLHRLECLGHGDGMSTALSTVTSDKTKVLEELFAM